MSWLRRFAPLTVLGGLAFGSSAATAQTAESLPPGPPYRVLAQDKGHLAIRRPGRQGRVGGKSRA